MSKRDHIIEDPKPLAQTLPPEEEPKEEPKSAPEEPKEREPSIILSHEDAYVHDRFKTQPKTLEEVDVQVTEKDLGSKHQLSLPDELKKYESRYTFHWIFKRKRAIDYSCGVRGWVLVKQSYFPELPKHYFTVSGSFERGDLILGFMPNEKAERIRREPGEKSISQIKGMFDKHKGDPRYYKPKDSETESEGSRVQMI